MHSLRRIPVSGSQFRRRSLPGPDHDPHLGHGDLDSLYLLILWLVCRRYGWRNTLLFLAALALALVLSDMLCGIFKHSGPLKHLLGRFFLPAGARCSPALEGLDIPADSLFAWRHAGLSHTEQPRTRSRRSRRREIRHRILPRRDDRGSRRNVGRRHPPPLVHMAPGAPQRC